MSRLCSTGALYPGGGTCAGDVFAGGSGEFVPPGRFSTLFVRTVVCCQNSGAGVSPARSPSALRRGWPSEAIGRGRCGTFRVPACLAAHCVLLLSVPCLRIVWAQVFVRLRTSPGRWRDHPLLKEEGDRPVGRASCPPDPPPPCGGGGRAKRLAGGGAVSFVYPYACCTRCSSACWALPASALGLGFCAAPHLPRFADAQHPLLKEEGDRPAGRAPNRRSRAAKARIASQNPSTPKSGQ